MGRLLLVFFVIAVVSFSAIFAPKDPNIVEARRSKLMVLFKDVAISDAYIAVCDPQASFLDRDEYLKNAESIEKMLVYDVMHAYKDRYTVRAQNVLDIKRRNIMKAIESDLKENGCDGTNAINAQIKAEIIGSRKMTEMLRMLKR